MTTTSSSKQQQAPERRSIDQNGDLGHFGQILIEQVR
jgi:hypothetical protein